MSKQFRFGKLEIRVGELDGLKYLEVLFPKVVLKPFEESGRELYKERLEILCDGDEKACSDNGIYIGSPEECTVEVFLNTVVRAALARRGIYVPEFQVSEEPGYSLPEYSLYWNYDARSFCGKWTWNDMQLFDIETQLCFGLCRDNYDLDLIAQIAERGLDEARKRGLEYVLAVYRDDD